MEDFKYLTQELIFLRRSVCLQISLAPSKWWDLQENKDEAPQLSVLDKYIIEMYSRSEQP